MAAAEKPMGEMAECNMGVCRKQSPKSSHWVRHGPFGFVKCFHWIITELYSIVQLHYVIVMKCTLSQRKSLTWTWASRSLLPHKANKTVRKCIYRR